MVNVKEQELKCEMLSERLLKEKELESSYDYQMLYSIYNGEIMKLKHTLKFFMNKVYEYDIEYKHNYDSDRIVRFRTFTRINLSLLDEINIFRDMDKWTIDDSFSEDKLNDMIIEMNKIRDLIAKEYVVFGCSVDEGFRSSLRTYTFL